MNYISTTGLRTQSSELISALLAGQSVDLIHRSKLVGRVVPVLKKEKPKGDFVSIIKGLPKVKGLTQRSAKKIYHDYLMKRYGKNLL